MKSTIFLNRVVQKFSSLNRKVDILSASYRKSCTDSSSFILSCTEDEMSKWRKLYQDWRGDLLISYFRPKRT